MYYYLHWSLDGENFVVESDLWQTVKGVSGLLEVLEIPYTIRCEPIMQALPGE